MPLSKIPLLLITLLSVHAGLKRPNPPPPPEERHLTNHISRRIDFAFGPLFIKVISYAAVSIEILVILQLHDPDSGWFQVGRTCRLISQASIRVTRRFVLGCLMASIGAALRLWCYHTLGQFFTFELSILPGHVLVTSGPYRFVRHPSYTGLFMLVLGFHLCFFTPGSFMFECGYLSGSLAQLASSIWLLLTAGICSGAMIRMRKEDGLLYQHFGEQWESWSRNVPYKLIPYLL